MTYPSNDHSIDQHAALHYPSTSEGSVGSFWQEKKRIREEEEAWWNSLNEEQRQRISEETKQREQDNYLYNK